MGNDLNYNDTKARNVSHQVPVFSKDTFKLLAGLIIILFISSRITQCAEPQKQSQSESNIVYNVWSSQDDFGAYSTLFEAKKQAKKCGCFITTNESDEYGNIINSKTYKLND